MRILTVATTSTLRARTLTAAVAAVCALTCAFAIPAAAQQDPPQTAAEAQQRVDDARAAANDAAVRLNEAIARYEQLGDEIETVKVNIAQGERMAAELTQTVRERAAEAYTRRGGNSDEILVLFSNDDLLEGIRRVRLLDTLNAKDDDSIDRLASLEKDLRRQKADLDQRQTEQAAALKSLEHEQQEVQARLAAAEQAQRELQERFAREAAAEAARRAAEAEAAAAAQTRSGPAGQIIVNPGGGPFQCPVAAGSAFSDNFGDPRSGGRRHAGIDMFAAEGTPLVAVAAGSMTIGSSNAGGNEVYLAANGNTYLYAHLSGYAGGARSVSQGEVLGYMGQTGNAQGSHLHFEIRTPSGAVNPYATLRQYC